MRRATVGDVMTSQVITIRPDTRFNEILKTLATNKISGVPVVGPEQRVLGVVSESDLLRKEEFKSPTEDSPSRFETPAHREKRERAEGDIATEIMTTPAVTVEKATTVVEAARLMDQHKHTRLPVVDGDGRLVGIVTRADLLKVFVRSDEQIRDEVTRDVVHRYLWQDVTLIEVDVKDGVVTLRGRVDLKSLLPITERLALAVEGVVRVVNELDYDYDDTTSRPQHN